VPWVTNTAGPPYLPEDPRLALYDCPSPLNGLICAIWGIPDDPNVRRFAAQLTGPIPNLISRGRPSIMDRVFVRAIPPPSPRAPDGLHRNADPARITAHANRALPRGIHASPFAVSGGNSANHPVLSVPDRLTVAQNIEFRILHAAASKRLRQQFPLPRIQNPYRTGISHARERPETAPKEQRPETLRQTDRAYRNLEWRITRPPKEPS
jgi:hypothetical protein